MTISKKITVYLALAAVLATAAACKKTVTAADLIGTWQLVNVKLTEKTVYGVDASHTSDTRNYYTTVKNAGIVTFLGDSTIATSGLTYSAPDSSVSYLTYLTNGIATQGTFYTPFLFVRTAANVSKDHYKATADSLFLDYPFLDFPVYATSSLHAPLVNYKFQISGNTLTLTTNVLQDSASFSTRGLVSFKSEGTGTITLQRQ